ncbi:hypothetical protein Tco_1225852 [Tanacetum coccineum]
MVINSPWYCTKALATPEQTATGKEILNPLIADSLLKTIRLSVHLVIAMKHSLVHSKGLMLWCISDEMQLKTKSQINSSSREETTAVGRERSETKPTINSRRYVLFVCLLMSAYVARGHGGDCGSDDRRPPGQIPIGCRGKGTRKPNRGGKKADRLDTHGQTRNLGLRRITDQWGPQQIQFEFNDRGTLMPLGDYAAH